MDERAAPLDKGKNMSIIKPSLETSNNDDDIIK